MYYFEAFAIHFYSQDQLNVVSVGKISVGKISVGRYQCGISWGDIK